MQIIGIDPGSRYTGYGLIDKNGQNVEHLASGRINATKGDTFAHRLEIIYEGLQSVLADFDPAVAAVETVFTAHNAKSTIKLGQARGVALLALRHAELELHEYAPAQVKKNTTGRGRATKDQVVQMVKLRLDLDADLAEDAADALAVAICHGQAAGFQRRLG